MSAHNTSLKRGANEIVASQLQHVGVHDAPFDVRFGAADELLVFADHQAQFHAASIRWQFHSAVPHRRPAGGVHRKHADFGIRDRNPAEIRADFRTVLDPLIARKQEHFSEYRRHIVSFDLDSRPTGPRLNVLSLLEKPD